MLQDYDRLASIIHQVFPLTEINKKIYGLDVDQLLDYYGTDAALPLEERLNKHDPVFQRVPELD